MHHYRRHFHSTPRHQQPLYVRAANWLWPTYQFIAISYNSLNNSFRKVEFLFVVSAVIASSCPIKSLGRCCFHDGARKLQNLFDYYSQKIYIFARYVKADLFKLLVLLFPYLD